MRNAFRIVVTNILLRYSHGMTVSKRWCSQEISEKGGHFVFCPKSLDKAKEVIVSNSLKSAVLCVFMFSLISYYPYPTTTHGFGWISRSVSVWMGEPGTPVYLVAMPMLAIIIWYNFYRLYFETIYDIFHQNTVVTGILFLIFS